MKELKIKILEWKDFTKWFWDKFCFPRRKMVCEWLDYHNDCLHHALYEIIKDDVSDERCVEIEKAWIREMKEITKRTKELIMMK